MIKKFKCLIFMAVMLIGMLGANVYALEKHTDYTMRTLLMETETGAVIKESGGYDKTAQGTLNKLMTVLLAAEEIESGNLKMDMELTVSSSVEGIKGAVIWLMPGENITVEELLKAIIIGNANDASIVIAEEIGGSEEEFVDMMNARAFELGMRNTAFRNAAGYDCDGQYSTAYDVALLCRELLKHEFLYSIMTTWTDTVRNGQTEVVNENKLVRSYDGITGLKAAHSDESGYCLALSAQRNGKSYIAVVLGSCDEDERFSAAKSLMSVGFSSYKLTTPSFSGEFIRPLEVKGGVDRAVEITTGNLSGLVVPENNGEIETVIFMPEYLYAPIKKGQKVGTVGFYNGDTLLHETDLITENAVKKVTFIDSLDNILHNMYK